ncbi:GGDEF domain-containing protein [Salinicola lusitanus]|uniref:diguanylate cyclase n=1 Tax=Salinicola lusitanus TaxID=1949085 RepID=A0ABZ3CYM5_9GAMM
MSGSDAIGAGKGRRWPVMLLIALAGTMIVAALAGLKLISEKGDDYASPGLHTEVWQSYQLRSEIQRLLDTAHAVEEGQTGAAALILRLGVMRNTLDPFRHSRVFDYLPQPRPEVHRTIAHLDSLSAGWMQRLDWHDQAGARRVAADMLAELPRQLRPAHELIVVSNIAVAAQLDWERQSLQRTFHWLTVTLVLLACGCLILALRILSSQRRSRHLAEELQALNSSLERRVRSRTRLLHEREALLRTILDSTPSDVTLISADQRRIFYISEDLLTQTDTRRAEEFHLETLFENGDDYRQLVARLSRGETVHQLEVRLAPRAPYWALLSARPLHIHAQSAWLIWSLDITRRKAMEHKLHQLASTDALTGLHNRRALWRAAVKRLRRDRNAPLSVLLIDIDHFKRINDEYGHPVGDQALCALARQLDELMQEDALLGRIGGEEFAVVLSGMSPEAVALMAERLRAAVADTPLVVNDAVTLSMTLSIGLTQRHENDSLKSLMMRADRALYRAKAEGRNRCCHLPAVALAPPALDEA